MFYEYGVLTQNVLNRRHFAQFEMLSLYYITITIAVPTHIYKKITRRIFRMCFQKTLMD